MNVRPVDARVPEAVPPWPGSLARATAAEHAAVHAGTMDGATVTGTAGRRQLSIRIGLWLDESGAARRARFSSCADPALRAYAEAACSAVEAGTDPARVDAALLRSRVQGATTAQSELADLVAGAMQAAALLSPARAR